METSKPILNKEFLSQFKTEKDLTAFFTDLYQQAINQMLEGEMGGTFTPVLSTPMNLSALVLTIEA